MQSSEQKHVPTGKSKQKNRFYCLETFPKMAPSNRILSPPAAMSGGLILVVENNGPQRERGTSRTPEETSCIGVSLRKENCPGWQCGRSHFPDSTQAASLGWVPVISQWHQWWFLHLKATYINLFPIAVTKCPQAACLWKKRSMHFTVWETHSSIKDPLVVSHMADMYHTYQRRTAVGCRNM